MANRANDDGTEVRAAIETLAEDCGISGRTAWRALESLLESKVVIDTEQTYDWGRGHFTRIYRIDEERIKALSLEWLEAQVGAKPKKRQKKSMRKSSILNFKPTDKTPLTNCQPGVKVSQAGCHFDSPPGANLSCNPVHNPVPSSLRSDEPVQGMNGMNEFAVREPKAPVPGFQVEEEN
jgi:hypothetical protein